jgi:hypothetical protein
MSRSKRPKSCRSETSSVKMGLGAGHPVDSEGTRCSGPHRRQGGLYPAWPGGPSPSTSSPQDRLQSGRLRAKRRQAITSSATVHSVTRCADIVGGSSPWVLSHERDLSLLQRRVAFSDTFANHLLSASTGMVGREPLLGITGLECPVTPSASAVMPRDPIRTAECLSNVQTRFVSPGNLWET